MSDIDDINKVLQKHEKRISDLEKKLQVTSKLRRHYTKKISAMILLTEMKKSRFFDKPKSLSEIIKEMGRRGHNYKRTSLTQTIQRAIRQQTIHRKGKRGSWQYGS
ncbi:MAG: hypothetical protein IIA82_08055 [Thaumarchaeota archaeon]|nr:hypothetical protein [Nitrososphaerota archaeon]